MSNIIALLLNLKGNILCNGKGEVRVRKTDDRKGEGAVKGREVIMNNFA